MTFGPSRSSWGQGREHDHSLYPCFGQRWAGRGESDRSAVTPFLANAERGQRSRERLRADIWISCQARQDIQAITALTEGPKGWIRLVFTRGTDPSWNGIDCTVYPRVRPTCQSIRARERRTLCHR